MRQIDDDVWKRRGFTILWSPSALGDLCQDTSEIISLRVLFNFQTSWPDDLPSSGGNATVVTGLEGCIDRIAPDTADVWLENQLRPLMRRYQSQYDDAALIFWMPTGEKRIEEVTVDDSFSWRCAPPFQKELFPISRAVFGGAHRDAGKIVRWESDARGHRTPTWIGIHLARIS
jgi:hypothetical protein